METNKHSNSVQSKNKNKNKKQKSDESTGSATLGHSPGKSPLAADNRRKGIKIDSKENRKQ